MRFTRRSIYLIVGILVIVLLILNFAWYPYQKGRVNGYLKDRFCQSNSVEDGQACPWSGTDISYSRLLLGIGVHYSYAGDGCPSFAYIYKGNLIFTPFKTFDLGNNSASAWQTLGC
jgi:hypothetical protein